MAVRFRYLDVPVPRFRDLVRAVAGRRFSVLELYLLAVSCAALLVFAPWWVALAVPLSAIGVELVLGERTRRLARSWRAVRRRRSALNGAEPRERRRAALADHLAGLVHQADYAWRAYIADATMGRTQSVISDRPAPKVQPLRRLAGIRDEAARLLIELEQDDEPAWPGDRLAVPSDAEFAPDILSPTMMNLNAASIAHAAAEGASRAQRRHRQAVDHAAEFAPLLSFADGAVAALQQPPADRRRGWRPWRRAYQR